MGLRFLLEKRYLTTKTQRREERQGEGEMERVRDTDFRL